MVQAEPEAPAGSGAQYIRAIFPGEKKCGMPQLALRLLLNPGKVIAAMNGTAL